MKNSDKLYVYLAVIISTVFLIFVFIDIKIKNERFKNVKMIEKSQEINITVRQDYVNRGEIIFNDKYFVMDARLKNPGGMQGIFYIEAPYNLIKKANNDTIYLSNKDTTVIMVLE